MEVYEPLLSCLSRGNGNRQQGASYAAATAGLTTTQIQHKPKDCLGSSKEIWFVMNSVTKLSEYGSQLHLFLALFLAAH